MPYKFETEKKKIPRELNKNVKLSLADRDKIREEYKIIRSQRKLADKWNVSRRLIQFILDPDKEKRNKDLQKQRNYYDKDKNTQYMKKHRRNKKELSLKGDLI